MKLWARITANPEGVGGDVGMTDERSAMFWLSVRQGILLVVDAIERFLGISPTTAEVRAMYKASKRGGDGTDR